MLTISPLFPRASCPMKRERNVSSSPAAQLMTGDLISVTMALLRLYLVLYTCISRTLSHRHTHTHTHISKPSHSLTSHPHPHTLTPTHPHTHTPTLPVETKAQAAVGDKVKHRLEQLDDLEEGSVKETLNLTQQDYVKKIDDLNRSLMSAWDNDQRVKALKIAIQV